jgi:threonine dehydratase
VRRGPSGPFLDRFIRAAAVAAARTGKAGRRKVVCAVSGGNIDTDKLVKILAGQMPE